MGDWESDPLRHHPRGHGVSDLARDRRPELGARPNWSPYVKHHLFWNLDHDVTVKPPAGSSENMTLPTGLALGVADSVINQILATINDKNAAITRVPREADGGGSVLDDMKETAQIEVEDAFGLDKDARLQEGRQWDAEENRPEPLNPPFPFRGLVAFGSVIADSEWESCQRFRFPGSLHRKGPFKAN